jgi:ribosomal protein L37AE/L43A
MVLARRKWRRVAAASIPRACEVCREGPVTTLVADFIFACDSCAKRIATALWHGRQDRVDAGENVSRDRKTNDRETNQRVHRFQVMCETVNERRDI